MRCALDVWTDASRRSLESHSRRCDVSLAPDDMEEHEDHELVKFSRGKNTDEIPGEGNFRSPG